MSYEKILFSGCSFTDGSGFNSSDLKKYHWTSLVGQHYNAQCYNIAMGGLSNSEIFFRTIEHTVNDKYDLTIVAWTSLSRMTIYYADQNVDTPTIVNPYTIGGFNSKDKILIDLAKIHYGYFNNYYMHLKHWLLQIISLANFLTNQQRSYVFVKGFENYLSDFFQVSYNETVKFSNVSEEIKSWLDFDNRPDNYIKDKVESIQTLISKVKALNWVNLDSASIFDSRVDVNQDGVHPGPLSNKTTYTQIVSYLES